MFKEYRENLKLTQEELAKKAGLSLVTIKRIEEGKGNPKITSIKKVIKILNIKDEDILKYLKR